jgi:D-alanyl-lipoteichoic acid acyltransferase DltB (MBOAT superfamily)
VLAIERLAEDRRRRAGLAERHTLRGGIVRWLITFHVVCLAWIFFRAETVGDASTSATEYSFVKRAYGLCTACCEFFTLTCAKSALVAPYRSMRRRAWSAK